MDERGGCLEWPVRYVSLANCRPRAEISFRTGEISYAILSLAGSGFHEPRPSDFLALSPAKRHAANYVTTRADFPCARTHGVAHVGWSSLLEVQFSFVELPVNRNARRVRPNLNALGHRELCTRTIALLPRSKVIGRYSTIEKFLEIVELYRGICSPFAGTYGNRGGRYFLTRYFTTFFVLHRKRGYNCVQGYREIGFLSAVLNFRADRFLGECYNSWGC